jgi:tetratricopeptide (TPR) repeat protein
MESLLGLGVARGWLQDQEGCRRWLGTALNVAERHDIPRGKERALERLARFESLFGNHDIACRLTNKVIREALDEGRARRTALLTYGRAGDLDACRHHAELAAMILEAHGRMGELAGTLNDLATMLTQGGDHVGAIEAIEQSLAHARRSGSMHALSFGLGSLGLIHLRCGQLEQAATALEEAVAMSADNRLNRLLNAALVYPLAAMGRWREVDVAIEGARDVTTTFGEDDVPDFLARGARHAREAGEVQRAERAEAVLAGWRLTLRTAAP